MMKMQTFVKFPYLQKFKVVHQGKILIYLKSKRLL